MPGEWRDVELVCIPEPSARSLLIEPVGAGATKLVYGQERYGCSPVRPHHVDRDPPVIDPAFEGPGYGDEDWRRTGASEHRDLVGEFTVQE